MKAVTITSQYGKTMEFKDHYSGDNSVSVTVRDDDGKFVRNILLPKTQVDALRDALALPVVPSLDVYMILRQKVGKPTKVRACYNGSSGQKEYQSKASAQADAVRLNAQYGTEYTYFVVKKETV